FVSYTKIYKPDANYRRPYRPTIQFLDAKFALPVRELVDKYNLDKVKVGELKGYKLAEGFNQNRFLIRNQQVCR
ncbi:MAG: hypothetical protein NE330_14830, partial [Lentisphaeraceae bacterium]|nr:hypothetical protein [Lentisphaeraceae bacterium]